MPALFTILLYFLNCSSFCLLLVTAVDLRARGPPSIVIQTKSGRTVGPHSQIQTNASLGLWCQAVNGRNMEVVSAQQITFRHLGQPYTTQLDKDGKNATLFKEAVTLADAGIWTCDVKTRSGNVTGDISVYLRPVVVSNSSLRIDDHDSSKYHFDASGHTVVRGDECRLECPVFSYPRSEIRWTYKGKAVNVVNQDPRISVKDGVLLIKNVTDADDGIYICTASNSFKHKGRTSITCKKRAGMGLTSLHHYRLGHTDCRRDRRS
jgi:hypothetical protein